jgi:hypothetical protein
MGMDHDTATAWQIVRTIANIESVTVYDGNRRGVTPVWWTVKDYATKPSAVHPLSYAAGDK